ncbi:hypothetical protein DSO57_1003032 [Entomophthora muscae]|uniref:Uncharacterized protein n=1 Tax=Entomophthora muscae TaxID=34485 RepID=A0ACC2SXK6_9FUNG|nr:hypothetical protein DSO57_1003032 [Entomophthora muscae]
MTTRNEIWNQQADILPVIVLLKPIIGLDYASMSSLFMSLEYQQKAGLGRTYGRKKGTVNSLPPLALDRSIFPCCTKKGPKTPAKPPFVE